MMNNSTMAVQINEVTVTADPFGLWLLALVGVVIICACAGACGVVERINIDRSRS